MLFLVRADRDEAGLVQQDVRGHQDRIGKQAGVDVVGVLGGLVLELGHPVQFAHVGETVQDPGQFRVGADMALAVQKGLFGVDSAGQVQRGKLQAAPAELRRILADGDGVLIHHAVDAVVLILERGEAGKGADIVAQGQGAAGLDAGENDLFFVLGFHLKTSRVG